MARLFCMSVFSVSLLAAGSAFGQNFAIPAAPADVDVFCEVKGIEQGTQLAIRYRAWIRAGLCAVREEAAAYKCQVGETSIRGRGLNSLGQEMYWDIDRVSGSINMSLGGNFLFKGACRAYSPATRKF